MLAQQSQIMEAAVETIYDLTADEAVREQCKAREKHIKEMNTVLKEKELACQERDKVFQQLEQSEQRNDQLSRQIEQLLQENKRLKETRME